MANGVFHRLPSGDHARLYRLCARQRCSSCGVWAKWMWLGDAFCDLCVPVTPTIGQRQFWEA